MNWNQNKSVLLSKVCVGGFALMLALTDLLALKVLPWFFDLSHEQMMWLMALVYLCSVPAWAALWCLWKLLGNLSRDVVFDEGNVRLMRMVSWQCFTVAALCLLGTVTVNLLTMVVLAAAAAFMGLIVRIVKNAFQQAISMKDELDFTI